MMYDNMKNEVNTNEKMEDERCNKVRLTDLKNTY